MSDRMVALTHSPWDKLAPVWGSGNTCAGRSDFTRDEAVPHARSALRPQIFGRHQGAWPGRPGRDHPNKMPAFLGYRDGAAWGGLPRGDTDRPHSRTGNQGRRTPDRIIADLRVPERQAWRLSRLPQSGRKRWHIGAPSPKTSHARTSGSSRSRKLRAPFGDLVLPFFSFPRPDKWKLSAFDIASASGPPPADVSLTEGTSCSEHSAGATKRPTWARKSGDMAGSGPSASVFADGQSCGRVG